MKLKKKTPNFKGQIKLIVAILYTKYKNMSMVGNNLRKKAEILIKKTDHGDRFIS